MYTAHHVTHLPTPLTKTVGPAPLTSPTIQIQFCYLVAWQAFLISFDLHQHSPTHYLTVSSLSIDRLHLALLTYSASPPSSAYAPFSMIFSQPCTAALYSLPSTLCSIPHKTQQTFLTLFFPWVQDACHVSCFTTHVCVILLRSLVVVCYPVPALMCDLRANNHFSCHIQTPTLTLQPRMRLPYFQHKKRGISLTVHKKEDGHANIEAKREDI